MLNFFAVWHSQRLAVRELSRLSDRELADVGIARSDIQSIVRRSTAETVSGPARTSAMAPSWGHHNRRALAA